MLSRWRRSNALAPSQDGGLPIAGEDYSTPVRHMQSTLGTCAPDPHSGVQLDKSAVKPGLVDECVDHERAIRVTIGMRPILRRASLLKPHGEVYLTERE